jgi:AraC family transcriptional regulator
MPKMWPMPYQDRSSSTQNASEADALMRAHMAAIAWIENHLFEPMTVKSIADQAGYSPSRFSRGFTRLQGESVMSYVRGRRLEAAMRRILTEPAVQIVDLAFDSGFDSQEAFTRAFARAFGHPPGRLRSLGPVSTMLRRKKASSQEPEIHERSEQMPELHLAGVSRRITMARPMELPEVWQQVEALRGFPGILDSSTYLLILEVDRRDGSVEMMPSIRIAADATPPAQLSRRSLPASSSSVYRHLIRKGDVYPQIQAAREAIFKRRFAHPTSARPLFPLLEVYPQGLGVRPGSWIDHYFPVSQEYPA